MRAASYDPPHNNEAVPHAVTGVARLAEQALEETRYGALRGVVCHEYGGVIRLGGSVPSQYLKQVAFATVCQVVGARPVVNDIQVVPTTDARSVGFSRSAASGWFNAKHPG